MTDPSNLHNLGMDAALYAFNDVHADDHGSVRKALASAIEAYLKVSQLRAEASADKAKGEKLETLCVYHKLIAEKWRAKAQEQATHIFCDNCFQIVEATFEPMTGRDPSGAFVGGDIVCDRCKFIVARQWRASKLQESIDGDWSSKIEDAPKDVEILVCGGTISYDASTFREDQPCEEVRLVHWDANSYPPSWRGEIYDGEPTRHKPLYWMLKPAPPNVTPTPTPTGARVAGERVSEKALALVNAKRRFNKPLPENDPDHETHRMVGFVVPHEIAGMSDALFLLDEIRAALATAPDPAAIRREALLEAAEKVRAAFAVPEAKCVGDELAARILSLAGEPTP